MLDYVSRDQVLEAIAGCCRQKQGTAFRTCERALRAVELLSSITLPEISANALKPSADREQYIKDNAVAMIQDRDAKIERMRKELAKANRRDESHRDEIAKLQLKPIVDLNSLLNNFPDGQIEYLPNAVGCDHGVTFDALAARGLSVHEVRQRWPRLDGPCPKGCGYVGIGYYSFEHYVMGDW